MGATGLSKKNLVKYRTLLSLHSQKVIASFCSQGSLYAAAHGSEHSDLYWKVSAVQHLGIFWEFSSAGSEHLPYKQRVGGSNPSTPTQYRKGFQEIEALFLYPDLPTF